MRGEECGQGWWAEALDLQELLELAERKGWCNLRGCKRSERPEGKSNKGLVLEDEEGRRYLKVVTGPTARGSMLGPTIGIPRVIAINSLGDAR